MQAIEQPAYLSTYECKFYVCYIYAVEFNKAIEKNEIMAFVGNGIQLEVIMPI